MMNPKHLSPCCIITTILCMAILPAEMLHGQRSKFKNDLRQYGHNSQWQSAFDWGPQSSLAIAWNQLVGEGRSQIVGTDKVLYVTSGTQQKKETDLTLTTHTRALNAINGETLWVSRHETIMHDSQEAFGGEAAVPQATPAIVGPYLLSLSFTGRLTCLRRTDGATMWEKDLVAEDQAEPVQFGFSSSPVFDPDTPDRVFILASGRSSGLLCLDVKDGTQIWQASCQSCSYATPVSANFGGIDQWIIVSENDIIGVAKSDGSRLWNHPLPDPGLTNVPSPLVMDDKHLVVSGQGCKGTRCLSVTANQSGNWEIKEQWFIRKIQFFYTNWTKISERVIVGCTNNYLAAIDASDGSILGRWRGYGDGNVHLAKGLLWIVDGKGNLHVLRFDKSADDSLTGLTAIRKLKVLDARCWAPLSIVNDRMFIRGNDRLACLSTTIDESHGVLENLLSAPKSHNFQTTALGQ